MALNIVSLIMQYLAPSLVGNIGKAIGVDSGLAQKAIGAAVPAILSGLTGLASKPEGARQLSTALQQQDPGLLGNLTGMIGGSGQSSLISSGTGALTSLLGGSALGSLTGAVSKFAGMGDAPTKSLLGILGPVVLGTLGQQQKRSNLDATSLASMLAGQKDNVASAMPAGFSQLLAGSGLLDSISSNIKTATSSVAAAATTAAATATAAASSAAKTATTAATGAASNFGSAAQSAAHRGATAVPQPKSGGAPLWLLALAALAAFGAYTWFNDKTRLGTVAPVQRVMVGNVDLGGQMTSAVDQLRVTLGTVKDAASAQAAMPRLREAAGQLEKIQALGAQAPADGKRSLAAMAASALKSLDPIITGVLGSAGVGAVVKPTLDAIRGRLETMAKT
jgi:hypothetical protein